jgi:catechol 2,3-dioxygenase-like lactoylglutathione lyase family enzyme
MKGAAMGVKGMNHFTVLTNDFEKTMAFYTSVLGLENGYRPLQDTGAWLYAGGQAVLHVVADRPVPKETGGVLDHMAFTGTDLTATCAKLRSHDIKFQLYRQVTTNLWQMFLLDPNGAKVELDFDASESAPADLGEIPTMGLAPKKPLGAIGITKAT